MADQQVQLGILLPTDKAAIAGQVLPAISHDPWRVGLNPDVSDLHAFSFMLSKDTMSFQNSCAPQWMLAMNSRALAISKYMI